MADDPDPPRKLYGFKEREFQRDNVRSAEATPTAQDLAKLAGPVVRTPTGGQARRDDPNDVYRLLQENRTAEQQHGADEIEIRRIRSRRRRDYFLLLVGGNLAIIAGVGLARFNIISVLFGGAGVILFSISLTWIMWQVMNRY